MPTTSVARAAEDLEKFAKANEKQLYKLLRVIMEVQTDLKTLLKSYVRTFPFRSFKT